MRTCWIWSVGLGRWWGIHVRLHLFFVILALFGVYVSSQNPRLSLPIVSATETVNVLSGHGIAFVLVLFVSVVLHEIGHILAARRLGGLADEMVIGPFGGLSPVRVPYEPHSELVAMMAGPLMNAAVCLLAAIGLAICSQQHLDVIDLNAMLNPLAFDFRSAAESGGARGLVSMLKLIFWVNWSMILVNLIPAYPFDGGNGVRAIFGFFWPEVDPRHSLTVIARLGKVIALVLLVAAWFVTAPSPENVGPIPTWFVLVSLAVYLFFNAQREETHQTSTEDADDTLFGYDFSQGYTSLERGLEGDGDAADKAATPKAPVSPLNLVSAWLEQRRQAQLAIEKEQEAEDERRVDEVLARLHELGMRSLTQEDRALLDRVSRRYRSRQD